MEDHATTGSGSFRVGSRLRNRMHSRSPAPRARVGEHLDIIRSKIVGEHRPTKRHEPMNPRLDRDASVRTLSFCVSRKNNSLQKCSG